MEESKDSVYLRHILEANVLIHEYFGVNAKIVWDTCKIDLPKLKEIIKAVI